MRSRVRTASLAILALAASSLTLASAPAAEAARVHGTTRTIVKGASVSKTSARPGSGAFTSVAKEIPKDEGAEAATPTRRSDRSLARRHHSAASTNAPAAGSASVVGAAPRLSQSFDGLDLFDQRTANGGNQFTVEPPDQALCVGGGHVVEAVNDVFRSFTTTGAPETRVIDLNTFFGYPAQFNRTTGDQGPFVTDPSCLFDPTTQKFFLTVLTLEVVPATGDFTGRNHLDTAVFSNPGGRRSIYRLDVTDDGKNGTPTHRTCPCIGDFPHVGVDANGYYITTNEYPFFTDGFVAAQIYAFNKRALARGATRIRVTQFDTSGLDRGNPGFTVWPAQSPSTADYSTANGGTEFFLSSNAAEEVTGTGAHQSNTILRWALTGTSSLTTNHAGLALSDKRIGVDTYSTPPPSNQKPGPVPLAECLNKTPCAKIILGAPDKFNESEGPLDSSDTRMMQVTYTGGQLFGALDTAVRVAGAVKAGIDFYVVNAADAVLANQGTLAMAGNNLIYPAIGITSSGAGIMSFTLVGDDFYPSAAYTSFAATSGAGPIVVAAAGLGPQDGFSEYRAFGDPPRPRWGDYGATAVDGATIWSGVEYIGQTCTLAEYQADPFGTCGGTRVALGNWDTRISQITP